MTCRKLEMVAMEIFARNIAIGFVLNFSLLWSLKSLSCRGDY
jgi:hypothetical protein